MLIATAQPHRGPDSIDAGFDRIWPFPEIDNSVQVGAIQLLVDEQDTRVHVF